MKKEGHPPGKEQGNYKPSKEWDGTHKQDWKTRVSSEPDYQAPHTGMNFSTPESSSQPRRSGEPRLVSAGRDPYGNDTYKFEKVEEETPQLFILSMTLGQTASFGGLIDHLPFSQKGTFGRLAGMGQKIERSLGGILVGPTHVAGLPDRFKDSSLARAIPNEGLAARRAKRFCASKPIVNLGKAQREGHILGIQGYLVQHGIHDLIRLIIDVYEQKEAAIPPTDVALALAGVLEAVTRLTKPELRPTTNQDAIQLIEDYLSKIVTPEERVLVYSAVQLPLPDIFQSEVNDPKPQTSSKNLRRIYSLWTKVIAKTTLERLETAREYSDRNSV